MFESVRILDNFYQTSSFFPMPVVLVRTIADTARIFLNVALRGIVEEAKRAGVAVITPEFLDTVREKRANEKGR